MGTKDKIITSALKKTIKYNFQCYSSVANALSELQPMVFFPFNPPFDFYAKIIGVEVNFQNKKVGLNNINIERHGA